MIRPTSPVPASSSASIPKDGSRWTGVMSGRRTRLPQSDPEVGQGVDASSTEGQEAGASVQRTAISVAGQPG